MTERYVVTRTIAASPAEVFAVLADPDRHQDTEPGDWVRAAIDPKPITGTGEMFALNMFLEEAGGHYVVYNLVTEFERDRTIAWLPGQLDDAGRHDAGGWWWRYDLAPNGEHTDVTVTYDWTETPQTFRDQIGGMPPFPERYILESLAALDRSVQSETPTR
ncbi:SRPBCC family protein [soil metagenome]